MSGPPELRIRTVKVEEVPALYQLMYDTVRTVSLRDYTPEQVQAWAPDPDSPAGWAQFARLRRSLLNSIALVAERGERPVGFGNITPAGFLDYLYVHKAHQGVGVASRLIASLEQAAGASGVRAVETHASHTLRPLLLRRGYRVFERRTVVVAGIFMENFRMLKRLSPDT